MNRCITTCDDTLVIMVELIKNITNVVKQNNISILIQRDSHLRNSPYLLILNKYEMDSLIVGANINVKLNEWKAV